MILSPLVYMYKEFTYYLSMYFEMTYLDLVYDE